MQLQEFSDIPRILGLLLCAINHLNLIPLKVNKAELYDFVDCLLVGFIVDSTLSTLQVISEAYYPSTNGRIRDKGLIKSTCSDILLLHIEKDTEFDFDLQLSYDANGNDVKANEIYSFECIVQENNILKVTLRADFLNFDLTCRQVEIAELNKV
jgi:hypothetical protein